MMGLVVGAVLALINAVYLWLLVIGLPGTWLMVATLAVTAFWVPGLFWWGTLVGVLLLAVLGEWLEFWLGVSGARHSGGGWRGMLGAGVGAVMGGIVGTPLIPIPVLGTLIGSCLGAGIGAAAAEMRHGKNWDDSMLAGRGAAWGRLTGTLAKLLTGVLIWGWISIDAMV